MSFLKAEWRKLALANYAIDPSLLRPYLPLGTELDLWQQKCYVSLVGFMFVNTRVLGLKIPFHVNFEEVNLRFYVKHKSEGEWRRGVVFIKEIVPRSAITFVANTLYKEHYQTLPMRHQWAKYEDHRLVEYEWKCGTQWQGFKVKTDLAPTMLTPDSEAHFITEHYWGYTKVDAQTTFEYEVAHPQWEVYPLRSYEIDVDFGLTYGANWACLNGMEPASVMLAEGSVIGVEGKRKI